MFAGNFAIQGWALCNGQLLSIAQNTALFSLMGTYYGGDGVSTFALPNLQSRVAIHQGQGPGLSPYVIGQTGGTENTTLNANNLPAHTHPLNATSATGTQSSPSGGAIAQINSGTAREPDLALGFAPGTPTTAMATGSVGANTGGGQPFNGVQPYLVVNFIIALEGIYPSRN
jgi:microcystin-dependent protein